MVGARRAKWKRTAKLSGKFNWKCGNGPEARIGTIRKMNWHWSKYFTEMKMKTASEVFNEKFKNLALGIAPDESFEFFKLGYESALDQVEEWMREKKNELS